MKKFSKKFTNKLVNEKSPYLLQHAHNPVNWYPWGKEAFKLAKEKDKPIFLSVGYSTCHWCHVMEHESFENEKIASIMNELFINIKVDREERPDVDRVYMSYVQAISGSGGWPMSVFLTPDLKPFYGGTYFAPDSRYGRPGFITVMQRISELWENQKEDVKKNASYAIEKLKESVNRKKIKKEEEKEEELDESCLEDGVGNILDSFDDVNGGYGSAPKFPRPVIFNFLYRMFVSSQNLNEKLTIQKNNMFTLIKMSQGGMYDHLGGGFHRYSVDEEWHVPHFEKMLYDQSQLIISLLETYQITKEAYFTRIARETIEYLFRDMLHNGEIFYSAEDADSLPSTDSEKKTEGAFYVWKEKEIVDILKKDKDLKSGDIELFKEFYDIKENGNVKPSSDPHGELKGQNVLIQRKFLSTIAKSLKLEEEEVYKKITYMKKVLFKEREKRPRPHLDDKIITCWNGLMISALSRASQIMEESIDDKTYLNQAKKIVKFIKRELYDKKQGILMRSYRNGVSPIEGFLVDYSFTIAGLIDLYETCGDLEYLQWAIELQEKQIELFYDKEGNGFFDSTDKDDSVLIRMKDDYDGAEPSGNSISAMNLIKLYNMLHDKKYKDLCEKTLKVFSLQIQKIPHGVPQLLCAFANLTQPGPLIVILFNDKDKKGPTERKDLQDVANVIHEVFKPRSIIWWNKLNEDHETFFSKKLGILKGAKVVDDKPTIYLCQDQTCQLPTTSLKEFHKMYH